jgi:hypothetical protein
VTRTEEVVFTFGQWVETGDNTHLVLLMRRGCCFPPLTMITTTIPTTTTTIDPPGATSTGHRWTGIHRWVSPGCSGGAGCQGIASPLVR